MDIKNYFLLIFLLAGINQLMTAQTPEYLFKPTLPVTADTVYYPFYDDEQMIELDYIGHWDKEVHFHEQTRPRAIPYSMMLPLPHSNVYLFRNRSGKIIKAFNTTETLEELTRQFSKIPINQKSRTIHSFFPWHAGKETLANGAWIYNNIWTYRFNGFYKIYDMSQPGSVVGLIDSLGNIRVPVEYEEIYALKNNLLIKKEGKWGVIDKQVRSIIPPEYDGYNYESEDIICFTRGEKLVIVYSTTTEKLTALDEYDEIINIDQLQQYGVTAFKKDQKIGFIDKHYKEIVPAIYDMVGEYYPSLNKNPTLVYRNSKWGYINAAAKEVIPCKYDYAERFDETGITLVQHKDKWICINKVEKKQAACNKKPNWEPFEHGNTDELQVVKNMSVIGDYYGLINRKNNKLVLPLVYDYIRADLYYDNIFRVKRDKKWGLANAEGKFLVDCEYEEIGQIDREFTVVKKKGFAGVINRDLKLAIPCIYQEIQGHSDNLFVFRLNDKMGLMDSLQNVIIPNRYDQFYGFHQLNDHEHATGLSMVMNDSLYGYINLRGEEVIPVKFKWLDYKIYNGLVAFGENGKYGYVDTAGTVIIPAAYDRVWGFEKSIAGIEKEKKWAFIDTKGTLITPFIYDLIVGHTWMDKKYMVVVKNGKHGVVNTAAKEIIPCKYNYIKSFTNGYFYVESGSKQLRINEAGVESP
jgi:hypothetical protein